MCEYTFPLRDDLKKISLNVVSRLEPEKATYHDTIMWKTGQDLIDHNRSHMAADSRIGT